MSDNDISQIKERLIRLETQVEEKWSSHDKRADERWTDLMEQMHELKNSRACVEHAGKFIEHNNKIKELERWRDCVNWAIGVVYVALIGSIVSRFWGH